MARAWVRGASGAGGAVLAVGIPLLVVGAHKEKPDWMPPPKLEIGVGPARLTLQGTF